MITSFPLTFQQQWLLELNRRHRHWHCVAGYTFRLKGLLDIDLLQQSLADVVRRHGSLRARLAIVDGVSQQLIGNTAVCLLEPIRVPGTSQPEIEANATRAAEELYDLPMQPYTAPLWSATVLRLTDGEHWLVLVMHRLIAECASIERVFLELRSLYEERTGGGPSPFPDEPPQYSDYALGQQSTYGDWVKRHEAYWNTRLAGANCVRWPVDRLVEPGTSGTLGKVTCSFGSTLGSQLQELARKLRTLSATIMLAVYAVTLWRWSRQNDFVLPFNVAGRQSEHRPIVGYFSYILHLRVEIVGTETFREFVGRIGNEFYRALAHQDFGRVATNNPGLLASTLFQWITWHPEEAAGTPGPAPDMSQALTVDRVPIRNFGEGLTIAPPGMVDVEITLFDAVDGLWALGTYRADRFSHRTLGRFMEDLRAAAQRCVLDPDARLTWS